MPFCSNCGKKLKEKSAFCSSCGSRTEETGGGNETQKPVKIFIILTLILTFGLMLSILVYIMLTSNCGAYSAGSSCDFGYSVVWIFNQILSIIIFPIYSIIMLIYIFSKKHREQYLLAVSLIILSMFSGIAILLSSYFISLLLYFTLFVISLYSLLKIKK